MPELLEILLLAIASAFWPILIAIVLVALRSPNPEKLLVAFYAGAMLTTVTIGVVLVHALAGTSVATTSRQTLDPAVAITIGTLALIAAYVLERRVALPARGTDESKKPAETDTGPSWWEKMLERGAPLAFVAGILLNVFPGFFPFVALKDIAELDYGFPETLALIVAFYVVMFVIIELPIVGYLFLPRQTTGWATRFNGWLDRNGQKLVVYALAGAGAYLVVRGVIGWVT